MSVPIHSFPATGGDAFFYIKSNSKVTLHLAGDKILQDCCSKTVDVVEGFKYDGGKDLTGFIDGTRNAPFLGSIMDTAIIHEGDESSSENIGGSYLLVSRFVHDLSKFNSFTTDEKSRIIGRDYGKIQNNSNPRLPDALDHLQQGAQYVYPSLPSSNYHINRGFGVMFRQVLSISYCFSHET